MFNSAQFEKLDFDVFSKKQLKENSLRSIYGGAAEVSTTRVIIGGGLITYEKPTDTIDDEGCTRPYDDPDAAGNCDAPSTE